MQEKETDVESNIQSVFDLSQKEIGEFRFRNRNGVVNWNKVVLADIDKIIKEKNFVSLKENVLNIINYDIDTTATSNILDPSFVKLFRLSQLTVEYLLYVHKSLRKILDEIIEKEKEEPARQGKDKNELISDTNEMKNIFNRANTFRKGAHLFVFGNEVSNIFRCEFCGKVFLDGYYLAAHQHRRHSDLPSPIVQEFPNVTSNVSLNLSEKASTTTQRETQRIWKELELLRQRVNECESCKIAKKNTADKRFVQEEIPEKRNYSEEEEIIKDIVTGEKPTEKKSIDEKLFGSPEKRNNNEPSINEEPAKTKDGRLEAQERVWRGRLKALADESSREIASLREMITSYQEKERALEEEYKAKIEDLTSQLKEHSESQFEAITTKEIEKESDYQFDSPSPSMSEKIQSPPSSRETSVPSSPSPNPERKDSVELNTTFTYADDEKTKSSDSEIESTLTSISPNMLRLPDCQTSYEEENIATPQELFLQKLKHLGINPKAKKIPEKVFKEKMEVIRLQQKDMAKNIKKFHQLRSNIEEKANARVSQRLRRHSQINSRVKSEKIPLGGSSHSLEKNKSSTSTYENRKNNESHDYSSNQSYKDSSVPSTSRSFTSNHSNHSKAKSSVIKSVFVESSGSSKPRVTIPGLKYNKGMETFTSYTNPKLKEKSTFPGTSSMQALAEKRVLGYSAGGSILRLSQQGKIEDEDKIFSLNSLGSKSVSFSLANDKREYEIMKGNVSEEL